MSAKGEVLAKFRDSQPMLLYQFAAFQKEVFDIIRNSLDRSVNTILASAGDILSEEEMNILQSFEGLYKVNSDSSQVANKVNEEVDDIFEQAQAQMAAGKEIDVKEGAEEKNRRLAMSGYQKHLEMLHVTDESMKDNVGSLVAEFQCHDLVRQILDHLGVILQDTIAVTQTINNKDFSLKLDIGDLMKKMNEQFATKLEREVFSKCYPVLPGKPFKLPASCTMTRIDLLDRFFSFLSQMLDICVKQVEDVVMRIGGRLNHVLSEAERLSNFSSDSLRSMTMVRNSLVSKSQSKKLTSEFLQGMVSNLADVTNQNDLFAAKISPILDTLQFQDRMQHHISNFNVMIKMVASFLKLEREDQILQIFDPESGSFQKLGEILITKSTVKEGRKIIQRTFL